MESTEIEEPKVENPKENFSFESSKFKFAVFILIVYLAFVAYLVIKVSIEETKWTRLLFLCSGIEAIVFAAVGYVFGRDISRKSEISAENKVKDLKKEKDDAIKEKEIAQKEAQKHNENLIRLQEAVISEEFFIEIEKNSDSTTFNKSSINVEDVPFSKKYKRRSLELALKQQVSNSSPVVSFKYKIEIDDFQSITVDGETKYSTEGYFGDIVAYGKNIEVVINRNNFKNWKFTAFDIIDEDGRKMIMSNPPLESNGTKSSFQIEYK